MRGASACRQCLHGIVRSTHRSFSTSRMVRLPANPTTASTSNAITTSARLHRNILSGLQRTTTTTSAPAFGCQTRSHSTNEKPSQLLLTPDNLFHPLESSPSPEMRQRAAYIKKYAWCPHEAHENGQMEPKHINFTCPDCGIPTYCCEEHWMEDYENHLLICDELRSTNEDDHDLVSGREHPEFEFPGPQVLLDALINFTNWDTYMYTRQAVAMNDWRMLKQASMLLTYPVTIASTFHQHSPYNIKNRLTYEGIKSNAALRYNLHPQPNGAGTEINEIRFNPPPVRIFIVGARAESSLPNDVWHQLTHIFPLAKFHLIFIGPEAMVNRPEPMPEKTPGNPFGALVERISYQMKRSTFTDYFHTLHKANYFAPYDPYFDMFVLFHPGLGHPMTSKYWEPTLPMLLGTKCPILVTGYTPDDMQRDIDWVHEKCGGEFDILLEPGENPFRSLRWNIALENPTEISQGNWGNWVFRGKRYEAMTREGEEEGVKS